MLNRRPHDGQAGAAPGVAPVVVAAIGVALFWTGAVSAALASPGYSQVGDYLSRLAARGSDVAPWAIGAFVASAVAHAAGAYALHQAAARHGRRRLHVAAVALALAALMVLAIAGFRLSASGPGDLLDSLHALAVIGYQLAWVVAVLARGPGVRGVAVAAVSTVLLMASLSWGEYAGLLQRAWVVLDQAWLLTITVLAARAAAGRGRGPGQDPV